MTRLTTAPRFLRLPEVLNLVGVTSSTLYRWMDSGTFPKQISVGGNTVVWVESAVTSWMQDQMTPTGGDLNTRKTLCWQGTHGCSAFFVPALNLP